MSEPWPFGTVVKLNDKALLATPVSDLPSITAARVMIVTDSGVDFVGVSLVDTDFTTAGACSDNWIRNGWEPVDE